MYGDLFVISASLHLLPNTNFYARLCRWAYARNGSFDPRSLVLLTRARFRVTVTGVLPSRRLITC